MERKRVLKDRLASKFMLLLSVVASSIIFAMIIGLYLRSRTILETKPLSELLFSTSWHPLQGQFGFSPFIMGTLWVTGVAVVIAFPLSIMAAMFLSEYAHKLVGELSKPLIDLLAGIPSVVYGVWGVLVIVPFVRDYVAPHFPESAGSSGYCILSGGIVLAVMICPIIIHVSTEIFRSVPLEIREASLSLGATKWQTTKFVVLRKGLPGVIAALVLGLSRAFGETMAVLLVVGNVAKIPSSVLQPAYPLTALIANNYGEMLSVPLYDSALLLASLILLLVVLFFNIVAQLVLIRIEKRIR